MPQSLARVILHTVFSTKDRVPFLQNLAFQDECRALLKKHGIAFDETYVWD